VVLTSRKNAWKKIHLSYMLLPKLCVHYANVLVLHNVERVYLFYSNPVYGGCGAIFLGGGGHFGLLLVINLHIQYYLVIMSNFY
jgi:hypothetical protein